MFSSVVPLVKLPMYKSSLSGLCIFFLLFLAIKIHFEYSVWVDLRWSVRGQSDHGSFFLFFCLFNFFRYLLFILCLILIFSIIYFYYISSVFLSGWASALVPLVLIYSFFCARSVDQKLIPSLIYFFYLHTTIRQKYMIIFHLFFLCAQPFH